jgi:hypothetical protein
MPFPCRSVGSSDGGGWATLARSIINIAEFQELLEKITDMAQDASEAGILAEHEAALYLQARTAAVRASRG